MASGLYILDKAGNPVPETDVLKWGMWLESAKEKLLVGYDVLSDGTRISTVFLGLDQSFGNGPPVLWEMMIFGGEHNCFQERYTSREDAVAGHAAAVCLARGALKKADGQ